MFQPSSLPPGEFDNARGYVCYERNLYYAWCFSRGLRIFPLLFMDRFLGWAYADGAEPLRAQHNGLEDFLAGQIRTDVELPGEDLPPVLREVFAAGDIAAVETWVRHTDGTPYVTSILLEGMDAGDVVYFAKFNDTMNCTGHPMPLGQLLESLFVYPSGGSLLTILHDRPVLDELARLDPREAYHYVFHTLFGYGWQEGRLTRHGRPVTAGTAGIDDFLTTLERTPDTVLTPHGVPKVQQFRLGRNVINRFEPIQQYLRFVRSEPALRARLDRPVRQQVDSELDRMGRALRDVMKFVSLLVQKPEPGMFARYLGSIRALRDLQPEYRQVNFSVLHSMTR